jgi:serine/threonine-protein kinase
LELDQFPESLGEFALVRRIGRGSSGYVFEVHSKTGARYAAKLILQSGGGVARERFRREAQLLARCDRQPGIVKVHSHGETKDGVPYLVMDLVEGESLEKLLDREGALPPPRALALVLAVARALGRAHALGIVHRDVKPSNVLLDASGAPLLTDFGLATACDLESLTRTGTLIGTPHYMAPEQVTDASRVGPAADVFSAGCILFNALAGRTPFEHLATSFEVFRELASSTPMPSLRDFAPSCPEAVLALVARVLEKPIGARPATGAALAEAIERCLGSSGESGRGELGSRGKSAAPGSGAGPPHVVPRSVDPRPAAPTPGSRGTPAPATPRSDGKIGAVGPYELLDRIGQGGVGTVYRARLPGGETVALKLLVQRAPADRARFEREVRLQSALGAADGFVPLLDRGESPGGPYLVMPLLSRGTLRARLEPGPLPYDEAVALVGSIAHAMGRAHELGIVHRDLKPENILFDDAGHPLVADLGLAKHFRADVPGGSLTAALSEAGMLRGTAGYMAPEQMRDAKTAGPPADVFALGVILYECLTGAPPFEGATGLEVLAKADHGAYEPIAARCPGASPAVVEAVRRALARNPGDRPRDAHAFALALGARSPRRSRLAFVLAALVLVVGAGAALAPRLRGDWREARAQEACARGEVLLRQSDLDGALQDFERALEDEPELARALWGRAEVRLRLRAFDAAIADATRALALDPKLVPAWGTRCWAKVYRGDLDGGIADANRALELDPGFVHALEGRSEAWRFKKDWPNAILDYTRILEVRREGTATFWANRGGARANLLDDAGAVADYEWALDMEPRLVSAWVNRAASKCAFGDFEGAIEDGTRALDLAPQFAGALENRASARALAGDLPGAIADATLVLDRDPRSVDALLLRAETKMRALDNEGALADLDKASSVDRGDVTSIHFDRGVIRERLRDPAGAKESYDRVLKAAEGTMIGEAVRWLESGLEDWHVALLPATERRLRELAGRAQAAARAPFERALLSGARGEDASAAFDAAVAAAPSDPLVATERARWLVGHERLTKAKDAIATAVKVGGDHLTLLRLEGDRLWREGKALEAAATFRALARDDPRGDAGLYARAALALLVEDWSLGPKANIEVALRRTDVPTELLRIYAYGNLIADLERLAPQSEGIAASAADAVLARDGLIDAEAYFLRELAVLMLRSRADPDPASFDLLRDRMRELVPSAVVFGFKQERKSQDCMGPRYAYLLGRAALTWGDYVRPLDAEISRRAEECSTEAQPRDTTSPFGMLLRALYDLRLGLFVPEGGIYQVKADTLVAVEDHIRKACRAEPGCCVPRFWRHRLARAGVVLPLPQGLDPGGLALKDPRLAGLGPSRARALDQRAVARAGRGDPQAAIKDWTSALELDPSLVAAYRDRGLQREAVRDAKGAIADLEEYLRLVPGAPDADDVRSRLAHLGR